MTSPFLLRRRYDGNSLRDTMRARLGAGNRTTPMWQSGRNLAEFVRWQFGTRCDASEARNNNQLLVRLGASFSSITDRISPVPTFNEPS